MENNNQYHELLVRYLANELNDDEKQLVENWVNSSDANKRYFDELSASWRLASAKRTLNFVVDEMNIDEKWNLFQQNIKAQESELTSGKQPEAENEEPPRSKSLVYKILIRVAVAASVLLTIILGWRLIASDDHHMPLVHHREIKTGSSVFVLRHEVNTTGKEKTIVLSDGSQVVLADKSEITFRQPFATTRDIQLIGKAFFKVAKDKTRPFTVATGEISTTALGTEFTITAFKFTNQIIVRLYQGKVVVRAVDKTNKRMRDDIYLIPGQQFIYGNQTTQKVLSFTVKQAAPEQIMSEERALDNPAIAENVEAPYIMFNNQQLSQVLDDLAAFYDVKIVYDQKDVQDIYFIGKYNKSAPLQDILERICAMNNLTVAKKDSVFIISH